MIENPYQIMYLLSYGELYHGKAPSKVVDDIHKPLKLYYDNEPAICYAHNNKSSGAVKHIDIKYYVVKDKVRDHTISLEHIRTEKMLVDPLTKDLPPNVFREHLAGMDLRESL